MSLSDQQINVIELDGTTKQIKLYTEISDVTEVYKDFLYNGQTLYASTTTDPNDEYATGLKYLDENGVVGYLCTENPSEFEISISITANGSQYTDSTENVLAFVYYVNNSNSFTSFYNIVYGKTSSLNKTLNIDDFVEFSTIYSHMSSGTPDINIKYIEIYKNGILDTTVLPDDGETYVQRYFKFYSFTVEESCSYSVIFY